MTNNAHGSCPAVVVHCMDWRLRNSLTQFLSGRFPEGYDLVSVAGGVKSLIADGQLDNFELEQLQLSNRLHQPEKVVLIQHEDCGAYGGSKAFGSFQEELAHQEQELQKAEALLSSYFAAGHIETYFIRLSGEVIRM